MQIIDLRSDTVTLPSQEMRDAMFRAELGDDVYGEDPTVNKLQELAAEKFGKESALFVASGSMGNLVSVVTHCGRGQEAIIGDQSHISLHEQGGIAVLGGIIPRTVKNKADGTLPLDEIESLISKGDDDHVALTRLICLENTWNGHVLKTDYVDSVTAIARRHNLLMHLDGARIFNASVALQTPVSRLTQHFDSVQFCFSKGLAAPVGSMICGSAAFIKEAKRNRKLLGGGMRQVGVIAAACLVSLEQMIDRLADDHANAKLLADKLANCHDIEIDAGKIDTNIVIFSVRGNNRSAEAVEAALKAAGVLVLALDGKRIRAVTHYGIEKADIEKAAGIIESVVSNTVQAKVAT
jgi:threonine aldolase